MRRDSIEIEGKKEKKKTQQKSTLYGALNSNAQRLRKENCIPVTYLGLAGMQHS